jgi:nicotinate-nucleotide adenylyltransferase
MIIGIMGGTFDPIHRGHLEIAEEARKELNMAEVIFVPAGQPYFKDMASISPAEHRINMVKLAISGRPYFQISLIEIERDGPTYAIDTISQLKAKYSHNDEIYYIMGWDSVMSLPRWQEPEKLWLLPVPVTPNRISPLWKRI